MHNSEIDYQNNIQEFTVSEFSNDVKKTIENKYGYVKLKGEISGYKGVHSSGHHYFSLKDTGAIVKAIIWRGAYNSLNFKPEEGLEVIATGKITTYPGTSSYQMIIERIEPSGEGALMALFEERKRKFIKEGLFLEDDKISLPYFPKNIAIITSENGAALTDILKKFSERMPVNILVFPVSVQGDKCPIEVANAIEKLNNIGQDSKVNKPDIIIVSRGGGSLEDLWGFNDELIIRAVYNSRIPIISGVGHEYDWTLIDFVADKRASTPTAAAEMAILKYSDFNSRLSEIGGKNEKLFKDLILFKRNNYNFFSFRITRYSNVLDLYQQRFDKIIESFVRSFEKIIEENWKNFNFLKEKISKNHLLRNIHDVKGKSNLIGQMLKKSIKNIINQDNKILEARSRLLYSLSYKSVLSRGFGLIQDNNANIVRTKDEAIQNKELNIVFIDGTVSLLVKKENSTKI
jgi:exodeoxyribonuclease VII large subunit